MNFKETLAEKTVHAEDVLTKYLPEEKKAIRKSHRVDELQCPGGWKNACARFF